MTNLNPRQTVDNFLKVFNAALCRDPEFRPEQMMDAITDDFAITVTGQHPGAGTHRGKARLAEGFKAGGSRMNARPGHGLRPIEYICDGDKVAVRAMARGENAKGMPYNGNYLLFFETRDGRVRRFLEDLDSSFNWRIVHDSTLVPAGGD